MQATKRQKFDRCNFKTYLKKKEQSSVQVFFFKSIDLQAYLMA